MFCKLSLEYVSEEDHCIETKGKESLPVRHVEVK